MVLCPKWGRGAKIDMKKDLQDLTVKCLRVVRLRQPFHSINLHKNTSGFICPKKTEMKKNYTEIVNSWRKRFG